MRVTMSRVNGVGYKVDALGNKYVPRKVIERNVLDMLEDNDKYMNLDFCDAEFITEEATVEELMAIYTETMTEEQFKAIAEKIRGEFV